MNVLECAQRAVPRNWPNRDDLVQEAALRLIERGIDPERDPHALSAARDAAVDAIRAESRRSALVLSDDLTNECVLSPHAAACAAFAAQQIADYAAGQPGRRGEALIMRVQGYSDDEIGEQVGVVGRTVRRWRERA